jgi:hypothetical protein
MFLASTAGDLVRYALAGFLVAVGLALGWALLRLAGVLGRVSSFLNGAEQEILPVINKVGGSIDRVNGQLDKLDTATDSAVDVVQAVDAAVRTVSFGVRRPVEKLVGFSSGASHGFATLKARRNWRAAMESAKEASARREADFEQELRKAGG